MQHKHITLGIRPAIDALGRSDGTQGLQQQGVLIRSTRSFLVDLGTDAVQLGGGAPQAGPAAAMHAAPAHSRTPRGRVCGVA